MKEEPGVPWSLSQEVTRSSLTCQVFVSDRAGSDGVPPTVCWLRIPAEVGVERLQVIHGVCRMLWAESRTLRVCSDQLLDVVSLMAGRSTTAACLH